MYNYQEETNLVFGKIPISVYYMSNNLLHVLIKTAYFPYPNQGAGFGVTITDLEGILMQSNLLWLPSNVSHSVEIPRSRVKGKL